MPSIRKKTSNRKSTNDRAKLRHKVAEGRKKNRKLAKKNPQWKSRVSKDPGIPNNLPFKDEILAEISEQRRLAAEEKAARKSSKKPLKHVSGSATGDDPSGSDDDGDENVGASVGVNTIRSAHALSLPKKKSPLAQPLTGDDDEPLLMDPAIPDLGTALDAGNVWLYVLDARDPLAHQSAFIESMAVEKKKTLIFVLNKIDIAPKEAVVAWLGSLRDVNPTFPFRVSSSQLPPLDDHAKGKAKLSDVDAVGSSSLLAHLESLASSSELTVTVIGFSNSGKSSVINSLCGTSRLPTYKPDATKTSTTTIVPQPFSFTTSSKKTIRFIDTPGLEASSDVDEDSAAAISDVLLRSRGKLERMKNAEAAAHRIIGRANADDIVLHYNTSAFVPSDPNSFLSGHARATGRIKRGGVLDLADSARSILRDWRVGKFPFYTSPSSSTAPAPSTSSLDYTAGDAEAMATLRTRKEMRTSGGLVRLASGAVDTRPMRLDAPPPPTGLRIPFESLVLGDEDDDEDEEGEEGDEDDWEDEDDEDDDEVEVEDELEPSPPPPPSRKRKAMANQSTESKRKKVEPALSKPSKKVTFEQPPPASKAGKTQPLSTPAAKPAKSSLKPSSAIKALKEKKPLPATTKKPFSSAAKGKNASVESGASEAYDFKQFF